jgi:hypothetical protein
MEKFHFRSSHQKIEALAAIRFNLIDKKREHNSICARWWKGEGANPSKKMIDRTQAAKKNNQSARHRYAIKNLRHAKACGGFSAMNK